MMNGIPFISVVIPVYNEEKHISKCLDSILAQDYPIDKIEVLVVDGMSEDGTRVMLNDYAKKYKNVKLIDNPRKVVPTALNIGIGMARGDIIARMDGHATYDAEYVKKCVESLDKTGADNVGGLLRHVGEGFIGHAIALAEACRFGTGGAKFRTAKNEQYVDTVFPGAWRRKTFEKYGYFNEKLIRNQDIEHNARIRKGGGKIFLTPEIISYYFCRSSLKSLWIQNFRNGFWNIKTIKIAPGSLSVRHFIPLFFVMSLLVMWVIPKLWLGIIISYMLCSAFFSLKIAMANGFKYFFIMPLVFLTLHLSYGFGLLAGIFLSKRE